MWIVDRSWEYINRSQTHECGSWELRPRNSQKINTILGFHCSGLEVVKISFLLFIYFLLVAYFLQEN
jgi:hypothetical protein